jgi:hypothetical protein
MYPMYLQAVSADSNTVSVAPQAPPVTRTESPSLNAFHCDDDPSNGQALDQHCETGQRTGEVHLEP